jgi:hypothetical protein
MGRSDDWYYADAAGQVGPLTIQELKKELATIPDAKSLLVWCEGMAEWQRAGDVFNFKPRAVLPPPLPPTSAPGEFIKDIKFGLKLFVVGLISTEVAVFMFSSVKTQPPTPEEAAKAARLPFVSDPSTGHRKDPRGKLPESGEFLDVDAA